MYPMKSELVDLAGKIGRPVESLRHKIKRERDKYKSMYGEKLVPPDRFTDGDLEKLRESFERSEWLDHSEKIRLSIDLGRSIHAIGGWFKFERKLKENSGDKTNKNKRFTKNQIETME